MIFLLTSNKLPIKSILDYNDGFILCLLHSTPFIPLSNSKKKYIFDIFFQEGMDVADDYDSQDDMEFNFHSSATMEEALTNIGEIIYNQENLMKSRDEDNQEELVFSSCCDYSWNEQVVQYLNRYLSDQDDSETTCLNLYRFLKIPSVDAMVRTLKHSLGTEFIYSDEPVAFGFAIHKLMGGSI